MTKLATLDLGTTASAGYQSLFELGPTVHPPARSRRPSLVITQNLHSVHSGIPVTLTDMEVVPPVVLKYLTVAPNGPLVTCDTSKGGLEFSASVAATAPPTVSTMAAAVVNIARSRLVLRRAPTCLSSELSTSTDGSSEPSSVAPASAIRSASATGTRCMSAVSRKSPASSSRHS